MKILLLTDAHTWSGGVEQLSVLAGGLKAKGEEVYVGCNGDSKIFQRAKELNLNVIAWNMEKEVNFSAIKDIINFVREKKIDVIHAHHPKAHTLGLIASFWLPEVVFLVTRRVIFKIRTNPLSKYKYRAKRVDKIIAVSEAVKKVLMDANISEEKISVIYSGVNLNKFKQNISGAKIREEFNIKSDEILIGKIANFSEYKGQDVFLKAAYLVLRDCVNAKFMLVGEGTQNAQLKKLAEELGITQNVIFTGYRKDIPEIISAFDVSVNASRQEGLAGVIRESSACGKAVIAASVGGNPEIVKHGETGYLFTAEDSKELADYILALVYDKNKMKKFGDSGRKFIEENFTSEIMVNKTLSLYKQLLEKKISMKKGK